MDVLTDSMLSEIQAVMLRYIDHVTRRSNTSLEDAVGDEE